MTETIDLAPIPTPDRRVQLRGGQSTHPLLDRIPYFDERSRDFQIRDRLRRLHGLYSATRSPRSYTWPPNHGIDQTSFGDGSGGSGSGGGCVGASGTHRLGGDSVRHDEVTNVKYARELYWDCQRRDPWEGGSYPGAKPHYEGTSVLALGQELLARGLVTEYRWVGAGSQTVMADIIDTLSWVDSIIFGITWLNSMFQPRPSGLLEVDVTSGEAGGHAFHGFALWLDAHLPGEGPRTRDLLGFQQSWGTWGIAAYGQPTGMAFIDLHDLEPLMHMEGEGMVPTEVASQLRVCPTCGQPIIAP